MKAEGANICASTDCLDLDADRDKTPRPGSPVQCGHSPGNTHGAVLNTGVLWFRSCEEGISLARQWALDTLGLRDPYSDDQGVRPPPPPLARTLRAAPRARVPLHALVCPPAARVPSRHPRCSALCMRHMHLVAMAISPERGPPSKPAMTSPTTASAGRPSTTSSRAACTPSEPTRTRDVSLARSAKGYATCKLRRLRRMRMLRAPSHSAPLSDPPTRLVALIRRLWRPLLARRHLASRACCWHRCLPTASAPGIWCGYSRRATCGIASPCTLRSPSTAMAASDSAS